MSKSDPKSQVHRYKCLRAAGTGPDALVFGRTYEFPTPVQEYLVREGFLLPVDDVPAFASSPSVGAGESGVEPKKRRGRPRKEVEQ